MAKKLPKIAKNKPKPRKIHATTKCDTFFGKPLTRPIRWYNKISKKD